jgi:hypothetical protein
MVRALLRLTLVVIVVLAALAFFMGYRLGDDGLSRSSDNAVGTTGAIPKVDTDRARETGAAIGEKVALGPTRPSAPLKTVR